MDILQERLEGGQGVEGLYDLAVSLRVFKAKDGLAKLAAQGDSQAAEARKKLSDLETEGDRP